MGGIITIAARKLEIPFQTAWSDDHDWMRQVAQWDTEQLSAIGTTGMRLRRRVSNWPEVILYTNQPESSLDTGSETAAKHDGCQGYQASLSLTLGSSAYKWPIVYIIDVHARLKPWQYTTGAGMSACTVHTEWTLRLASLRKTGK